MTPRVDVVRGDCAMLGVGGTLWFGVHQAKYRGNFDVMIYWDLAELLWAAGEGSVARVRATLGARRDTQRS